MSIRTFPKIKNCFLGTIISPDACHAQEGVFEPGGILMITSPRLKHIEKRSGGLQFTRTDYSRD